MRRRPGDRENAWETRWGWGVRLGMAAAEAAQLRGDSLAGSREKSNRDLLGRDFWKL
jgi:hypothetical protein